MREEGRKRVEWKGECVKERKNEEGGEGRGGGRERDTELEPRDKYRQQKQSGSMDDATMCVVYCTAQWVTT